jgi:hypothetical protein
VSAIRIRSLFALFIAVPLSAQTPRDSVHVAQQTAALKVAKARADSVNRALAQCAATKTCAGYLKSAALVQQRLLAQFPTLFAAESALVASGAVPPIPTPTPVPTPTPIDTTHGLAELPRVFLTTTVASTPSPGRSLHVPIGGSVQAALDSAQCGDKILLAASASFSTSTLYRKSCSAAAWITLTTEGCSTLPAEGVRVDSIAARCFAKIVTPSTSPALGTGPGASYLRVIGVEFTLAAQSSTVNYNYGLIRLGDPSSESTLASQAHHIILDRVYLHGGAGLSVQHAALLNGASLAFIDSYCSDIHWPGTETHCLVSWAGAGPFKIVNDYIEGASINLLVGGADPVVPNLIPSDWEIRRNHFFKPLAY